MKIDLFENTKSMNPCDWQNAVIKTTIRKVLYIYNIYIKDGSRRLG